MRDISVRQSRCGHRDPPSDQSLKPLRCEVSEGSAFRASHSRLSSETLRFTRSPLPPVADHSGLNPTQPSGFLLIRFLTRLSRGLGIDDAGLDGRGVRAIICW